MDSDEEKEAFEVTDYDLDNEFNPNRPQRRQTKGQSIYGIWSRESDDEEDQRVGLGGGSRSGGFDPLGDMGFISRGFKGDKEEEEVCAEGNDNGDDPGPSTSHRSMTTAQKRHAKLMKTDKEFARWQKHTSGFGEKVLLQMGYIPGKGLGKANQGIVRPVEATRHKGKGAIGHGQPLRHVIVSDEEQDEEEIARKLGKPVPKKGTSKWKKTDIKSQKKYVYKTVDEVKKTGVSKKQKALPNQHLSNVKVIDMTGPEQRVLSGYGEIARGHDKPEETHDSIEAGKKSFEMPELMHNLDLLVEMAEQRIIKHDRQLHHEDDMIVNLQHEKEKTSKVLEQEEAVIKRLSTVVDLVESLADRTQPGHEHPASLKDFEETLRYLREDLTDEWKTFQLVELTVALVFPLIRTELQGWNLVRDSKSHLELFKILKDMMDTPDCILMTSDCPSITAYERLVWEEWMPFVRRCVADWNIHDCDPLIEFLENWLPLVPRWVLDNVCDQLIIPKLQRAVELWNPLTDVVPLHSWLHPWLPLLGEKLAPLYIPIRQKFGSALRDWHPSDSSAKTILLPWKQVFSKGTMEAFVMRHISPKLAMCLQQFVINPYQQHLEPFEWVMAWEDFLPRPTLVKLFETNFFPKWLQVLCSWLNNNPNYQEVGRWYTGWKKLFPDYILLEPAIKSFFNQALEVMNRAVSGSGPIQPPPPMKPPPGPLPLLSPASNVTTPSMSKWGNEGVMAKNSTTGIPTTFKDLVERKAAESGILFAPTQRRHDGKTIYTFGHLAMFIEKGVAFVQQGTNWTPMSIYSLIDLALKGL